MSSDPVEIVEISSSDFAKACGKSSATNAARREKSVVQIMSFLEEHPANLVKINSSVFSRACGKISASNPSKEKSVFKSEFKRCCPILPSPGVGCPCRKDQAKPFGQLCICRGPEAVKKVRCSNVLDSRSDSEESNNDSSETQKDSGESSSDSESWTPGGPEAVKKACKDVMDWGTESQEFDSDRETIERNSKGSSDDSETPSRASEAVRRACKKIFASDATKEKPGKSESKHFAKLRQRSSRLRYCHSCRKNRKHLVHCSRCILAFCDRCLQGRHGEDAHEESAPELQWVCPKCRGGCGPGCEENCCTCCVCYRSDKGILKFRKDLIKDAKSFSSNLHDWLIHLQTGESTEEIANRKCSRGWTKAGGSGSKNSRVMNDQNCCSGTTKHNDRSDGGHIEAGVATVSTEKIVSKVTSCQNKVRRTGQKDDLTVCRSRGLGHHNQKIPTASPRETTNIDQEIVSPEKFRQGDVLDSSTDNEVYVDTTLSKSLNDSLVPFGDMAVNVYLMGLWFKKDRYFIGNRMSITLSDKEMKLKQVIQARSHAESIAYQFHPTNEPGRFLDQPQYQQEDMKNNLKGVTLRKELEQSKTNLGQVCEEIDLMISEYLPRVKGDVDLEMKRLTQAIEKEIDTMQRDPANLERDTVPHQIAVEKLVNSILWDTESQIMSHEADHITDQKEVERKRLSQNDESDRSDRNEKVDIGITGKALRAAIDFYGGIMVSVYLMRQWFSREKAWFRNRMLITLSDEELDLKNMLRGFLWQISLAAHMYRREHQDFESFKVNLRIALSEYSTQIQEVLQETDVIITKALPEVKSNGHLALESITEAVQKAVDAIRQCGKLD